MPHEIAVRHVIGRYPHGPAPFRSENIVASVAEVARVYRIRLEDNEHPDAWLEITVELDHEPVIVGETVDEAA